jgi:hypothetical protein
VSVPAGWQRKGSVATPGLALQNEMVLGPTDGSAGNLVLGTAPTTDPSLLPAGFLKVLPSPPTHQVVKLGGNQLYRYLDLQPDGGSTVSVYALPTTTAGTVLGACLIQGATATLASNCERVLSTLKLVGTSPAGLGPSSTLASGLSTAIGKLNSAVTSSQARLRSARKPAQQAAAAGQLATEYSQAAKALGKLTAPPSAAAAVTALATALAKTGHDYTALSRSAAHNNGRGYTAASNAITSDGSAINSAFAQLAKLGYVVA